ncbi:hypothetical protein M514_10614 [Trichuris suis]|uniref:SPIN-DOC-like zinc-finger domain-containing protein n=1 Tax=Trichuris suis TaxID=68888 RepID=A0A085MTY9_9BILA|nr:hypothetical protein M514_10614 [Trichuris suis]
MASASPAKRKRKLGKEGRVFQEKWELQYFCTVVNGRIHCLICSNSIATPKEYNLKRHYERNRRSYDRYDGPVRVSRLKQLKANLRLQQTCFTKIEKANVASVTASYELSRMIAMSGKSYSEGDFVKQYLLKMAQILCPEKTDLFRDISLSRNTIAERIDEMAGDLKQQLKATSSRFEHFSIAIDETVDITGIAQLAVFIRACDNEFNIYEELIKLIPMHDTATSQDIFDKVEQVLQDYGLDLSKLACLLPTALRIWLKEHLTKVHPEKCGKDVAYFRELRDRILKRRTLLGMMTSDTRLERDGLLASYGVALMIAKSGKLHTIGERLLLPAVSEVLRTMLRQPAADIVKKIPLSNDTVKRRIDVMAKEVEDRLCNILRNTEFSLGLDESTLSGNGTILLAYVRFINDEQLKQEFLFARKLKTDAKVAVATDGAPSMVGCHRRFVARLREVAPDTLAVHCVIHRQHLAAKRLSHRLNGSLQYVINAVNRIKSNSLKDRLFWRLCEENDEVFSRLLLHTEVRWLSKGACLTRFYELFESVLLFFEEEDPTLRDYLRSPETDIAYLADLYFKFNEMNVQLQKGELNLITSKSVISAFVSKLVLYKKNLSRGELGQFLNLDKVRLNDILKDSDIDAYCGHLQILHDDFQRRFGDLLSLAVPSWEELIDLQSNDELKPRMAQGYGQFWLQKQIPSSCPCLWSVRRCRSRNREAQPLTNIQSRGSTASRDDNGARHRRLSSLA